MNQPQEREITCPFCGSTDHELFSLFGQTLLGSQYYCHHCRTVFEAVRWEEPEKQDKTLDQSEKSG